MSDHIYKLVKIVGTSTTTIEDAVEHALTKASRSIHGLRWFHVTDTRGNIKDGKVEHWQVTLEVGFTLDE